MEHVLVGQVALIGVLGLSAQWVAWRFHLPAIVLLAAAGLLAGPVTGWLHPETDFGPLMRPMVGLAVAVILFEGGLNLNFRELQQTGRAVRGLVVLGVPVAWGLGTAAAHFVAGLSWQTSTVFGAILVVTGPTVILPLLRQAKLAPEPAAVLKWEAIVNDPIGALLAVVAFRFLVGAPGEHGTATLTAPLLAVLASAALGFAAGRLTAFAFQRGALAEFLKGPMILGLVLASYAAGNVLQPEAGLIAVTVLGVTLANTALAEIEQVRRVKEYLVVMLVSGVFVILSATLEPAMLSAFDWRIAAFLAVLLFAARPASVFLSTLGTGLDVRQKVLVGWIAPRGVVAVAVAGLFAPLMVKAGYADAALLVPLSFAVVFTTVIAHGFTLRWLARRLGLAAGPGHGVLVVGGNPWSNRLARAFHQAGARVLISDSNWYHMAASRKAKVPSYAGELLSDLAEHHLDLTPYDHVVAATGNDAYNALICRQMAPEVGRSHAYQIAARSAEDDPSRALRATVRGRTLMDAALDFDALEQRVLDGWEIAARTVPEAADDDDADEDRPPAGRGDAGEGSHPLALVRADGTIEFCVAGQPFTPRPGDVLLTFDAPADAGNAPLRNAPAVTP